MRRRGEQATREPRIHVALLECGIGEKRQHLAICFEINLQYGTGRMPLDGASVVDDLGEVVVKHLHSASKTDCNPEPKQEDVRHLVPSSLVRRNR